VTAGAEKPQRFYYEIQGFSPHAHQIDFAHFLNVPAKAGTHMNSCLWLRLSIMWVRASARTLIQRAQKCFSFERPG
jgi:hypothetical protein